MIAVTEELRGGVDVGEKPFGALCGSEDFPESLGWDKCVLNH
jgi:hypothetical protein